MISNTFKNLSNEKRIRVLTAAKKEFSRVPLEKALISNIVRNAKIPRGSFYQYFDTIEDVFIALLEYEYGTIHKKMKDYYEQSNNDYFIALKLRFSDILDYFDNGENRQYNFNLYSTLIDKAKINDDFFNILNEFKNKEDQKYIDPEILKLPHSSEFISLIGMIMFSSISKFIIAGEAKEKVIKDYSEYIDFIKVSIEKLQTKYAN